MRRIKSVGFSDLVRDFEKKLGFKTDIKWGSAFVITSFHILAVWWCYHYAFPAKWQTILFACFTYLFSGWGITGGVHRYWSHRSYKATRPFQIFTLICFATTGQTTVRRWVRNHRLHHKCSDTTADPHDANRGFFYSHIGWLMMKKNEEVLRMGKTIDMSDIENDPLLMWHERHVVIINILFCYLLPSLAGVYLCGEGWRCAVAWQCFIRNLSVLHSEMTVNSLAHMYGYKPYNRAIKPAQNWFVNLLTLGEGSHNYHHAFPYDYKASDWLSFISLTTPIIRLNRRLGFIYDLREATPGVVKSVAERLGDRQE